MALILIIRYGPGTGAIVRRIEFASFGQLERWRVSFNAAARVRGLGMIAEFEDQVDPHISDPPSAEQILDELADGQTRASKPRITQPIAEFATT